MVWALKLIPAIGRDIFPYPRFLQAPFSLALDTSRDEVATAFLGKCRS